MAAVAVVLALANGGVLAQMWQRLRPGPGSAVFDPARGRAVMFGWQQMDVPYFDDTWVNYGSGWSRLTGSNAPGPRSWPSLAYDTSRDRVIMFGGSDMHGFPNAETWEFDGADWQRRMTAHTPWGLGNLAFDSARSRAVFFEAGSGGPGVTWEYDALDWSLRAPLRSPSTRFGPSITYDFARARVVLFGGSLYSGPLNDTWDYDGSTWTRVITPVSPPPRSGAGLVYDVRRSRVVLFGGNTNTAHSQNLDDTWEFDGTNWQRNTTTPAPPPRAGHTQYYDWWRGRVVVYGSDDGMLEDGWSYDGVSWSQLEASPNARSRHAMVSDAARDRMVLFGGKSRAAALLGDTWEFDGRSWSLVQPAVSPSPRIDHAMVYDSHRQRSVLFGGFDGAVQNDTWDYDGSAWHLAAVAVSPPARQSHAMAYDQVRSRTVLFGGIQANGSILSDTWEYDGAAWHAMSPLHSPWQRYDHAMTFDASRGCTVMLGGSVLYGELWDAWEYDGVDWAQSMAATPGGRSEHSLAYDSWRGRVLMFGDLQGDIWEYDGTAWTLVLQPMYPPNRKQGALAFDAERGKALLFGGEDYDLMIDEWWLGQPAMPTWARHGSGCSGSNGVPVLVANNPIPRGSWAALQLKGLDPQPGIAFVQFGFGIAQWNGTALPIALDPFGVPGCQLWIAPAPGAVVFLAYAGSTVSLPLAIPNVPAFTGHPVAAQAFVFDGAAPNGVGALSNAVVLVAR